MVGGVKVVWIEHVLGPCTPTHALETLKSPAARFSNPPATVATEKPVTVAPLSILTEVESGLLVVPTTTFPKLTGVGAATAEAADASIPTATSTIGIRIRPAGFRTARG